MLVDNFVIVFIISLYELANQSKKCEAIINESIISKLDNMTKDIIIYS